MLPHRVVNTTTTAPRGYTPAVSCRGFDHRPVRAGYQVGAGSTLLLQQHRVEGITLILPYRIAGDTAVACRGYRNTTILVPRYWCGHHYYPHTVHVADITGTTVPFSGYILCATATATCYVFCGKVPFRAMSWLGGRGALSSCMTVVGVWP